MSLSLQIQSLGEAHAFHFDTNELAALHTSVQGDPELRSAYDAVFGSDELGEPFRHHVADMLEAVTVLAKAGAAGLSVATYSILESAVAGEPATTASSVSGIRIDGQIYHLKGGVNRCILECVRLSSDGTRVEIVTQQDVRGVSRIHTDNMGDIIIRKRSKPGRVLRSLRLLQEQLSQWPAGAVVEAVLS